MFTNLMMTPLGLAFDRWLVRWTGHSLLNRIFARQAGYPPRPALCLVTRGRRSGMARSVALPYFVLDGRVYLVGSKGGAPEDPFWVSNLRANPAVTVYLRRRRHEAQAHVTEGEERERLWRRIVELVPTYVEYQALTTRQIPVVLLEGLGA